MLRWCSPIGFVPLLPRRNGVPLFWLALAASPANAAPYDSAPLPDVNIAPPSAGDKVASDPDAETVELAWARSPDADGCLSGMDLKRAVSARLGRDPFAAPFRKQIDGYVSRKAGKWAADLVVRDSIAGRVGSRRLESATPDCSELDQAVILTITLMIDPNATLQTATARSPLPAPPQPKPIAVAPTITPAPRAPAPTPSQPQPSSPGTSSPGTSSPGTSLPSTSPATTPPARPTFEAEPALPVPSRLLVAPSVSYKLLPGMTPAVALRAELPLGQRVQFETSVAYFPEGRFRTAATDVGYSLTALSAGTCYHPNQTFALLACGSAWLGALNAVVYEGLPDAPGPRLWGGLRADVGASARSERLLVELRLFGMFPISRWNFQIGGEKTQFEQPFVAPGIEIGVGIQMP